MLSYLLVFKWRKNILLFGLWFGIILSDRTILNLLEVILVSRNVEEAVKEMTLMLMYLTSWKEKNFGFEVRRFWKGYNFGVIDELVEEGLIHTSNRSKSGIMTEEGEKVAKELLKKWGIYESDAY